LGVPVPQEIDLDATGVAIASGLCLFVSVLFGLLPAVRFSNPDLNHTLKEDARGGGRQTIRVHRIAALVQIGIAVPFLVISGVMIDRVRTADFGFPTDGLAGARVPVPDGPARDAGFAIQRVRDNLQQAVGVRSVALAGGMPIDFDYREYRVATMEDQFATSHVTHVAERFLETVGAPLLRGRTITVEDRIQAAPVAVISEPLAAQLFPDKEAIGEGIKVVLDETREQEFTVVGVTADFATSQLTTMRQQILLPLPEALPRTVFLIARGAPGDEPKLKSALEAALRELGVEPLPGVAFPGIVTGQDMVEKSKGDLVAEGTAVGIAGGLVLILAALGIVGVVGFMVATRTRELAVRMALGATRLGVFRMMLSDVVKLVIPGVVGGILIAAVLLRTMENVLGTPLTMGGKPLGVMEPLIYLGASAIAISVALLAGLPAARRATSVQPMVAIRSE
jgi:putative ABC transport system permease protein